MPIEQETEVVPDQQEEVSAEDWDEIIWALDETARALSAIDARLRSIDDLLVGSRS